MLELEIGFHQHRCRLDFLDFDCLPLHFRKLGWPFFFLSLISQLAQKLLHVAGQLSLLVAGFRELVRACGGAQTWIALGPVLVALGIATAIRTTLFLTALVWSSLGRVILLCMPILPGLRARERSIQAISLVLLLSGFSSLLPLSFFSSLLPLNKDFVQQQLQRCHFTQY